MNIRTRNNTGKEDAAAIGLHSRLSRGTVLLGTSPATLLMIIIRASKKRMR